MNIIIERGKICKLEELPEFSIALDGFVQGPEIDAENHRYSFDHHSGCSRFCTLAACSQAFNAIMLGLDPTNYTVYCNDVDIDTCAAVWCLKNPDRCKEPIVAKLIDAVGKGDMYAGAFELNGMKKVVEWISEPETKSKMNGDYEKLSNDGLRTIMESILHRIDQQANGDASIEISKQQNNVNFKIIRNENNWAVIESNDPHALTYIWQSGFDRIALIRYLDNGSISVTIAKRSDFIEGFPLNKIYKALNQHEQGWGGSSTIGGAPRNEDGTRTKLKLEKIIEIIDGVIDGSYKDIKKSKTNKKNKNSVNPK